ncbi:MAG: hypothetical protein QXY52_02820 [Conexivisphaerales archaeon]
MARSTKKDVIRGKSGTDKFHTINIVGKVNALPFTRLNIKLLNLSRP